MTYQALYRRYRPSRFDEVKGQTLPLQVITGALATGRVGHAYLFSGPRGCGKTSVARLFAKALNCDAPQGVEPCGSCASCKALLEGRNLDVIEIDGASNNTVDEVRALRSAVDLSSFGGKWKVYIIDEVHMLSQSAFNALLKTLEEPPEKVLFLLATTEPFKVPATIRSRCQHLPFQGIKPEEIVETLRAVATAEGATPDDELFWEIADLSDGGMRDALTLLEQVLSVGNGEIAFEALEGLIGGSGRLLRRWFDNAALRVPDACGELDDLFRRGAEPERFCNSLFKLAKTLWLAASFGSVGLKEITLSEKARDWVIERANNWKPAKLQALMERIAGLTVGLRRGLSAGVISGLLTSWVNELSDKPVQVVSDQVNMPKKEAEKRLSEPEPVQFEDISEEVPPEVKKETARELKEINSADESLWLEKGNKLPQVLLSYTEDPAWWTLIALAKGEKDEETYRLVLPADASVAWRVYTFDHRLDQLKHLLLEAGFSPHRLTLCWGDQSFRLDAEPPAEPLALPQLQQRSAPSKPTWSPQKKVEETLHSSQKAATKKVLPSSEVQNRTQNEPRPLLNLDDLDRYVDRLTSLYERREAENSKEDEEKE